MILVIFILGITFIENEASFSPFSSESNVIDVDEAVTYLNRIKGRTWTAGSNSFGKYLSVSEMKYRAGTIPSDGEYSSNPPTNAGNNEIGNSSNLLRLLEVLKLNHIHFGIPDYYDARTMYPYCTTISSIKDQSNCGSCWAVSTASVFSDRLCIKSKGLIDVNISSNHLLGCIPGANGRGGCNGGHVADAFNYLLTNGTITGGDYETFDGCQPYEIAPCGAYGQFPCREILTPKCRKTCTNEYYKSSVEQEAYKVSRSLTFRCNETHPCKEEWIRHEIYQNGPVVATLQVYQPFFFYKRGIFQLDVNKNEYNVEGYHSVRIIGWGVERDIPYWLIANSWSRNWGEDGTFKILRGKNHCHIESKIHFGVPIIPPDILQQLG